MATKYVNLTGTTKWVNGKFGGLFEADPKYGNFSIRLYPDPASWEKFKKSGLRLEPKTDDDGDFIVFRRPEQKLMNKELVVFGRPKVYFKEGVEPTRAIGNGTTIEVNLAVYDTREGKGHRLEAVRVLDLVKFEASSGGADSGFVELIDEGQAEPQSEGDKPKEDPNDELPFDVEPKKDTTVAKSQSASPFKRMSR